MLATRTTRSRRQADSGACRLLARVVFAVAMVIGAVFAHGGACAALEMAESADHSAGVRAAEPPDTARHAVHNAVCLHRGLPPRHQHGTELDCSATGPAAAPVPSTLQASAVLPFAQTCAGPLPVKARSHPSPGPHSESLCVMRV
ncbi:hypothetical protein SMD20_44690 [Nonomuraea sp. LP-02]|uniref:hypothetical protein n=1 Tax=Nonomuraea sp. LP-02 TaxID=3097960 RepID=UPI002E2F98DA|nr:hypothetical protein [Nonomuraea sp. LP-02]MED7931384.1 hypothetical protein [Nonomuraea sp. LP-02]